MMSNTRLRVYVAGAYSGPDVLTILGNMRRGMQTSARVLEYGMAPFCPWLDYHFALLQEGLSLQDFYDYSMVWLEASQAVLVIPEGADASKGTQAELARARELRIPIFWRMYDLLEWKRQQEKGHAQ